MKPLFIFSLLISTSIAFSQGTDALDKLAAQIDADDRLDELVEKISKENKQRKKKAKSKKEISEGVKSIQRSLNSPKLDPKTKEDLLRFVKEEDIEVYKAYVAEETKKEDLLFSGCEMSHDQSSINCGDKIYKLDGSIHPSSIRANSKTDMKQNPRNSVGEKAGNIGQ